MATKDSLFETASQPNPEQASEAISSLNHSCVYSRAGNHKLNSNSRPEVGENPFKSFYKALGIALEWFSLCKGSAVCMCIAFLA